MDSVIHRMEYVAVCVLVIASTFLLPVFAKVAAGQSDSTKTPDSTSVSGDDLSSSPNIVSRSLDGLMTSVDSAVSDFADISKSITVPFSTVATGAGRITKHGGAYIVGGVVGGVTGGTKAVGAGLAAVGHSAKVGAVTMVTEPIHLAGSLVSLSFADPVIKPSDGEYVPVIEPAAQTLAAVAIAQPTTAAPVSYPAVASVGGSAIWPIHGPITTEFGANDSPYQRYHTGIDISNNRRGSGVTPIHPFKPGTVTSVIHSRYGLGNHVIVTHGGGLTSVYGHMSSTSVRVGEAVDQSSVLGLVGSTGASTGPHVHFEIKLNGKYVNPHNYIKGRP